MTERRMISKKVVYSDKFFELSDKAKAFYTYLILEADDDGIVGNLKTVTRQCGANAKTVQALINQGFLLPLGEGIAAITHWHMQNKVRKDRYTETIYKNELSRLTVSNGIYLLS